MSSVCSWAMEVSVQMPLLFFILGCLQHVVPQGETGGALSFLAEMEAIRGKETQINGATTQSWWFCVFEEWLKHHREISPSVVTTRVNQGAELSLVSHGGILQHLRVGLVVSAVADDVVYKIAHKSSIHCSDRSDVEYFHQVNEQLGNIVMQDVKGIPHVTNVVGGRVAILVVTVITQIVSTNEKGDDFPVVLVTHVSVSF